MSVRAFVCSRGQSKQKFCLKLSQRHQVKVIVFLWEIWWEEFWRGEKIRIKHSPTTSAQSCLPGFPLLSPRGNYGHSLGPALWTITLSFSFLPSLNRTLPSWAKGQRLPMKHKRPPTVDMTHGISALMALVSLYCSWPSYVFPPSACFLFKVVGKIIPSSIMGGG